MSVAEIERDYQTKFAQIQRFRDLESGTHPIDQAKAAEWVNAQLSERRRQAAQLFIDNTHYITFNQLFEYARAAIINLYRNFLPATGDVYFYTGEDKTRSGYFMSLIGIHLIRQLGYREPIYVNHWKLVPKTAVVFVLDDCVYSGGQSVGMVHGFHELGYSCTLYICTAVITQYALDKSSWFVINGPNVKAAYVPGIVMPNLLDVVRLKSNRAYLDLRYFFSPFTEGATPPAIIYFDHKIADDNSTFQKVLLMGPVLPGNLQYRADDFGVYGSMVQELYGEDYLEANHERVDQEAAAYEQALIEDEQELVGPLRSIPFIVGCNKPFEISNIPYGVIQYAFNDFYSPLIEGYEEQLAQITAPANRCPVSFYKRLFK